MYGPLVHEAEEAQRSLPRGRVVEVLNYAVRHGCWGLLHEYRHSELTDRTGVNFDLPGFYNSSMLSSFRADWTQASLDCDSTVQQSLAP